MQFGRGGHHRRHVEDILDRAVERFHRPILFGHGIFRMTR